jgi:hypothetical protein
LADIVPLAATVPFAKNARIPPVDPFQGFALKVTPASTVTFVYSGTTNTCAALSPEVVYVLAMGWIVVMFPNA